MAFSKNVWNQLKGLTADDLIKALQKDGWVKEDSRGATIGFFKEGNPEHKRVVVHYHPKKNYGPKLLKELLRSIGWTEREMKRLKLIK